MSFRVIRLPLDWNNYGPRDGLEGPFAVNGQVLYYDNKVGQYYNPNSDFYLTHDEYQKIQDQFTYGSE